MKIIPWQRQGALDVFEDVEDIQRQMDRLLDMRFPLTAKPGLGTAMWGPAVDVIEEEDQIKVRADLPGMRKEDIEVSVENDVLTIKGEKRDEKEVSGKDCVRLERQYGAFRRAFVLPVGVDPKRVCASYQDGVLDVVFRKQEGGNPRQVKVQVE